MMKLFGICCSLLLLLAAASCGSNSPAESYPAHVDADFTAVYSPDKGGVTGSDGTISILLDDGTSLFMTGDCFLGEVVDGKRDPSLQMINNSLIHIAADGSYLGACYGGTTEAPAPLCTPLAAATSQHTSWYTAGPGFQAGHTPYVLLA